MRRDSKITIRTKHKYTTIIALILISIFVLSCARSKVGGQTNYSKHGDIESESVATYCDGQCMEFSSDGSCSKFTSDISNVCIRYFQKSKAIRSSNCSPIIMDQVGDINVTYNSKCQ